MYPLLEKIRQISTEQRLDVLRMSEELEGYTFGHPEHLYYFLELIPLEQRNELLNLRVVVYNSDDDFEYDEIFEPPTITLKESVWNSCSENYLNLTFRRLPVKVRFGLISEFPSECLTIFGCASQEAKINEDIDVVKKSLNALNEVHLNGGFKNIEEIISFLKSFPKDERLKVLGILLSIFNEAHELLFKALTIEKRLESHWSAGFSAGVHVDEFYLANDNKIDDFFKLFLEKDYINILKLKIETSSFDSGTPLIFQLIAGLNIKKIYEGDFEKGYNTYNGFGYSVLKNDLVNNLIKIMSYIPSDKLLEIAKIKDCEGTPVAHKIFYANIFRLVEIFFEKIIDQNQFIEVLKIENSEEVSLFASIMDTNDSVIEPWLFIDLLNMITDELFFNMIEVVDSSGKSFLQLVASSWDSIRDGFVIRCPEEKRFQLLKSEIQTGTCFVDSFRNSLGIDVPDIKESFAPDFILIHNMLERNGEKTSQFSTHNTLFPNDGTFAKLKQDFSGVESFDEAKTIVFEFLTNSKTGASLLAKELLNNLLYKCKDKSIGNLSEKWFGSAEVKEEQMRSNVSNPSLFKQKGNS